MPAPTPPAPPDPAAAADRRRWRVLGAVAYLAVMLVTAGGLWSLDRAARHRLDEALGQRLQGIAVAAALLVDGDSLQAWSYAPEPPLDLVWLQTRLQELRRRTDLAEITLVDSDGFVVASAAGRTRRGELDPFLDVDPDAVTAARKGFPAASRLYRTGDVYQKSAYAPVTDSDGRVTGLLAVEGDVDFFDALARLRRGAAVTLAVVALLLTLLALVLQRLLRALERARLGMLRQQNLAVMGQMTAAIAHEIRNPLGIIRGAAELQARKLRELGEDHPTLDFIPQEVDRLDRILTRYLAFGRGERPPREPVDVGRLARRVVRAAGDELARGGVTANVTVSGDTTVQGDAAGLQQVLLNLLLNARDAMPDGGEITVSAAREGDAVVLRVADRGTGLQGRDPEALFAAFRTTKEKGSGLGLAVVRRIVEDHGGSVTLRDRDDGPGAEAVVRLPAGDEGRE